MLLKILMFLIGCLCQTAWATVSLELEASDVTADETFRMVLTVEGDQANAIPDFSPLEQDFRIAGTQRSMNYTFINGNTRTTTQWIVLLMPKKTGRLAIPVIRVGEEKTRSNVINVSTSLKPDANKPELIQKGIMLTATAGEFNPYVNQQVIYTVKLYHSQRLLNIDYQPPQVEDAMLIPLGTGRHYQEVKKGYIYAVEEQQYAVFPQKKGLVTIKSPILRILAEDESGFPKNLVLRAKATQLTVKGFPTHFQAEAWIPAKQVNLSETYSQEIATIKAGEVLTRTISLKAIGIPGQLLPKLNFESNGQYSVYPEPLKEESQFQQGDIVGISKTKVTYLFNHAGSVKLPALQIKWFNTDTGKDSIAILPSKELQVITSPVKKALNSQENKTTLPLADLSDKKKINLLTAFANWKQFVLSKGQSLWKSSKLAWSITSGLILLWLVTLSTIFLKKNRAKKKRISLEKISTRNHCDKKTTKRLILAQLKDACHFKNAEGTKEALLAWARLEWPHLPFLSLGELIQHISDPLFKKEIMRLSQSLYGDRAAKVWPSDDLWNIVNQYSSKKVARYNKVNVIKKLPELHEV